MCCNGFLMVYSVVLNLFLLCLKKKGRGFGCDFLSFFFSFFLFLFCFHFVVFKEVCSVGLKEVYSILLDLKRVVCVGPKEVLFYSVGLKEI